MFPAELDKKDEFSEQKISSKIKTHYQWSANHYHSSLTVRIIRKSCIYFVGEIGKQSVVSMLKKKDFL
jgi:hypothetical protein